MLGKLSCVSAASAKNVEVELSIDRVLRGFSYWAGWIVW